LLRLWYLEPVLGQSTRPYPLSIAVRVVVSASGGLSARPASKKGRVNYGYALSD
jgi:hypothetical protein